MTAGCAAWWRAEAGRPHGVYPCRGDDRWIAIAVFDDTEWAALCGQMGLELDRDLPEDDLDARIADWTRGQEARELMVRLQGAGVEACAVQKFSDLQEDPQLAARDHWVDIEHPHLGSLRFERSGFRLSEGSGAIERPGPLLGQHNREILSELVGYSDEDIDRLIAEKVVA